MGTFPLRGRICSLRRRRRSIRPVPIRRQRRGVRTCHVGFSRICYDFPAILYAEPPRNRRAEPSRSFRVGFGPRIFSFPAHTLISISPLTPASFFALLLFSLFTLMPAFALISDFPPIPPRFFRLYSCFRPSSLHSYSFLFPIFPQSRSAFSGFTPVFVLHPYTRIRFYLRFFPQSRPAFSGFTPVSVLHPYTYICSY